MLVSEMNGIRPVDAGRQDCHDLHSWGPGVRQCYIIHYIISGKGTFTCGKKTYTLTAGQSFLICPEQVVQYAPDEFFRMLELWTSSPFTLKDGCRVAPMS